MKEEKKEPTPGNKILKEEKDDDTFNYDQESAYDDSSEDDNNARSGNKKRDLNKPKNGGVLNG